MLARKRSNNAPLVIGHRGACGHRPEHTLASYSLAIELGADFIEPDLVFTRDRVLVARHENDISATTNVADRPEFASRRTSKRVDGRDVTGWFTEDFTLAELRSLRARERFPGLRPGNTAYDDLAIPTFDEILALATDASQRAVGVYPETKHPSYFESLGLRFDDALLDALHRYGQRDRDAPVFIQSFEAAILRRLRPRTSLRLVQLIDARGAPFDAVQANQPRTYADMTTPAGLAEIARYADAVGVHKDLVIPRDASGALGAPTSLVDDAHAAGLDIHAWTFRNENQFLPRELRSGDPAEPEHLRRHGDAAAEYAAFFAGGLDGVFSDFPDAAVAART